MCSRYVSALKSVTPFGMLSVQSAKAELAAKRPGTHKDHFRVINFSPCELPISASSHFPLPSFRTDTTAIVRIKGPHSARAGRPVTTTCACCIELPDFASRPKSERSSGCQIRVPVTATSKTQQRSLFACSSAVLTGHAGQKQAQCTETPSAMQTVDHSLGIANFIENNLLRFPAVAPSPNRVHRDRVRPHCAPDYRRRRPISPTSRRYSPAGWRGPPPHAWPKTSSSRNGNEPSRNACSSCSRMALK